MKLTFTFNLVKQLFEGACKVISVTQPKPPSMNMITDLMGPLSVVSEWVKLGKRSACCMGVMRGLELAKAYHPGLKPEVLATGFPEFKADNSKFTKDDHTKVRRETRSAATKIADGMDLNYLEAGYDDSNKRRRVDLPSPTEFSLLPSPKKASETVGSVETTSGAKGDDLKMDEISD